MYTKYETEVSKKLPNLNKYNFASFSNYRHKLIDSASQKDWNKLELKIFIKTLYTNEVSEFVNKYTNNVTVFNNFIKKYGENSFFNIIEEYFYVLNDGFARISSFEQNYFSLFYNPHTTIFTCEFKIQHLQSLSELQEPYLQIFKKASLKFFKERISNKFVYSSIPNSFGSAHNRQFSKGNRNPEIVKQIIDFMLSKNTLYTINEINEMANLYFQSIIDRTKINHKRFDPYSIKPNGSTISYYVHDNFYENLNGLYIEDLKYLLVLAKKNIGDLEKIENLILTLPTHNLENESERLDVLIDFACKIPELNKDKVYEVIRQNKNNLSIKALKILSYNILNLKTELIEEFKNELKFKDLDYYNKLELENKKHNNKINIRKNLKIKIKKLVTFNSKLKLITRNKSMNLEQKIKREEFKKKFLENETLYIERKKIERKKKFNKLKLLLKNRLNNIITILEK